MKSMQDMEENLILRNSRIINEYEKKNAEFLRQKEFAMHDGGYQLDQ